MIAKPKTRGLLLVNGGKEGSILLHPNQKWEVTLFQDDKNEVGIEHGILALIISKELFKEKFAISF